MATTRLQKLIRLLDSSNSSTRKTAAKQICEIAKAHPQQLVSIIRKVHACLYSKNWDTRVAVADTLGLLAQAFPHPGVADLAVACPGMPESFSDRTHVSLDKLDISKVLEKGAALVASGGQEYESADEDLPPAERLAKQRSQLKKRLGLGPGPLESIMDTDSLVDDADISTALAKPGNQHGDKGKAGTAELLDSMLGLSARERNRLKRKAKAVTRTDSGKSTEAKVAEPTLGRKTPPAEDPVSEQKQPAANLEQQAAEQDQEEWKATEKGAWPFQQVCDRLCLDILDPCWEVRHGASAGLREILRYQAAAAAIEAPVDDAESGWASPQGVGKRRLTGPVIEASVRAAAAANAGWLEECLELLLCVLALDQYADYASDQVVVPVRETSAQALGSALQPLDVSSLKKVLQLLLDMYQWGAQNRQWHVRHGGFTGLKYLLASRPEAAEELVPLALPALLQGLKDTEDSVQAAAADALVPMAPLLLQMDPQVVAQLRDILWRLLQHMEDLSVATCSTLALLAALYSPPAQFQAKPELAKNRLPSLWPYLSHQLYSVRQASMTCLQRLVHAGSGSASSSAGAGGEGAWLEPVLGACLRLVFQQVLTEGDDKLQGLALGTWRELLATSSAAALTKVLSVADIQSMMLLAATPLGQSMDTKLLLVSEGKELLPMSEAIDEGLVSRPSKKARLDSSAELQPMGSGGSQASEAGLAAVGGSGAISSGGSSSSGYDPEQVVGSRGQEAVVRMRLAAAEALGSLCHKLGGQSQQLMAPLMYQQLMLPSATSRLLMGLALCNWIKLLHKDLMVAPQQQQQQQQASTANGTSEGYLDHVSRTAAGGDGAALQQQQQHSEQQRPAATAMTAAVLQLVPEQLLQRCLEYLAVPSPCTPSPPSLDPYSEVLVLYSRMRKELVSLLGACLQAGWKIATPNNLPVDKVSSEGAIAMMATVPPAAEVGPVPTLRTAVLGTAYQLQTLQLFLHCSTCNALAAALVLSGKLPPKLNLIIPNIMLALRSDPSPGLQRVAAESIAELLMCCASRVPCPNDKVLKNICSMAVGDVDETPCAADESRYEDALEERRQSHKLAGPSSSFTASKSSSDKPLAGAVSSAVEAATAAAAEQADLPVPAMARRGAELALAAICQRLGAQLFTLCPILWDLMAGAISAYATSQVGGAALGGTGALEEEPGAVMAGVTVKQEVKQEVPGAAAVAAVEADAQAVVNALQIVKVVVPCLHEQLLPQGLSLLPGVTVCLGHCNAAVRLAAARCAGALAAAQPVQVLPVLLRHLLPLLEGTSPDPCRLGAVEATAQLVNVLGMQLVPFVVLMIVPLLRRMSDPLVGVREKAAHCFGRLIALLPLAQGCRLPEGLDEQQRQVCERDREFLSQLLDSKKVEDYELPVQLSVTLRHYQQEGINWLAFLHRFGLHGVLADDMGLGKTLQATSIMACSLAEQAAVQLKAEAAAALPATATGVNHPLTAAAALAAAAGQGLLPSLVVCPSTLVAHWAHEIQKYVGPGVLSPLPILGGPAERAAAQKRLPKHQVAIISYEALRTDVEWAASVAWDYVILDEGHVIRSTKSKVAQAVKKLVAQHRLILSGTPIQNNALELWSLFDFLMPGFLGSEQAFQARYGRAVHAARYSKKGSKEADAGLLALDALHKQVMPFVLRRTKQQVLSDLPPKIITDITCELTPFQRQLYEDFTASQALSEVAGALKGSAAAAEGSSGAAKGADKVPGNVLSALMYLRKLCSHPAMALDWQVPAHVQAAKQVLKVDSLAAAQSQLRSLDHCPKLLALRDIFVQCGLIEGATGSSSSAAADDADGVGGSADSGHRLLVFAQLKQMLDLAERDLLQPNGISYLRLDGGTEASQRFAVVQQFNADPTIQVLLLTTHVGGLGLNLTSADTVVFLEHDWNPMKDLQAMDRAHRLGQTRTVNVYRLLMQDTLEERIMGLQQFKLDVANTVVNEDNMSMKTMDTSQLLDLFAAPGAADGGTGQQRAAGGQEGAKGGKSGLAQMLQSMGDLWDDTQYESEFDMRAFLGKLGKQQQQQQGP